MDTLIDQLRREMDDIRASEGEELADIKDRNCYAAGWCAGAIAVIDRLKEFLDEMATENSRPIAADPGLDAEVG